MYKAVLLFLVLSFPSLYPRLVSAQTFSPGVKARENFADGRVSTEVNADAKALYKTGLELLDSGQASQAAASFQQALKLEPDYVDAYEALGRAYFKMREWQKAIDSFRHAASLNTKIKEEHEKLHKTIPARNAEAANQQDIKPIAKPEPKDIKANLQNTPATRARLSPEANALAIPTKTEPSGVKVSMNPTSKPPENVSPASSARLSPETDPLALPTKTEPSGVKASMNPTSKPSDNVIPAHGVKPSPEADATAAVSTKTQPSGVKVSTNPTSKPPENMTPAPDAKSSPEADAPAVSTKPQPTDVKVSMHPTSKPAENVAATSIAPIEDVSLTKIYRIGPNDVLDVRLNENAADPKSTLFTITPSGLLEFPLLNEPLLVSGLTVEELSAKIEDELTKRALVESPKVAIGVRDYESHTILVSGLVKESGTKILRREAIPLYVVVADAQPLPEAAKVTVVRNETNQMYEIDLARSADMNLLVRPGDVITVHPNEMQFVYVGGEVKSPGEKTFRRGLTLTQVIISAGGVIPKAKVAQLARDDGHGFLSVTRIKLKEIESGKAADPSVKPGDRIMILR